MEPSGYLEDLTTKEPDGYLEDLPGYKPDGYLEDLLATPDPNAAGQLVKGVGEGLIGGGLETVGAGMQWLNQLAGIPPQPDDAGGSLVKAGKAYRRDYGIDPSLGGFQPKSLDWWAANTGQLIGSVIPSVAASIATAGAGAPLSVAALAGGMVGGAQEAGSLYTEMLERGEDPETAALTYPLMLVGSGLLNAAPLGNMLRPAKGITGKLINRVLTGGIEAGTEMLEEPMQAGIAALSGAEEDYSAGMLTRMASVGLPSFFVGLLLPGGHGPDSKVDLRKKTVTVEPRPGVTMTFKGPVESVDKAAEEFMVAGRPQPPPGTVDVTATEVMPTEPADFTGLVTVADVPAIVSLATDFTQAPGGMTAEEAEALVAPIELGLNKGKRPGPSTIVERLKARGSVHVVDLPWIQKTLDSATKRAKKPAFLPSTTLQLSLAEAGITVEGMDGLGILEDWQKDAVRRVFFDADWSVPFVEHVLYELYNTGGEPGKLNQAAVDRAKAHWTKSADAPLRGMLLVKPEELPDALGVYSSRDRLIRVADSATSYTAIHEFVHSVLHALSENRALPKSGVVEDFLLSAFRKVRVDDLTLAEEEAAAEGFTAYLATMKAPPGFEELYSRMQTQLQGIMSQQQGIRDFPTNTTATRHALEMLIGTPKGDSLQIADFAPKTIEITRAKMLGEVGKDLIPEAVDAGTVEVQKPTKAQWAAIKKAYGQYMFSSLEQARNKFRARYTKVFPDATDDEVNAAMLRIEAGESLAYVDKMLGYRAAALTQAGAAQQHRELQDSQLQLKDIAAKERDRLLFDRKMERFETDPERFEGRMPTPPASAFFELPTEIIDSTPTEIGKTPPSKAAKKYPRFANEVEQARGLMRNGRSVKAVLDAVRNGQRLEPYQLYALGALMPAAGSKDLEFSGASEGVADWCASHFVEIGMAYIDHQSRWGHEGHTMQGVKEFAEIRKAYRILGRELTANEARLLFDMENAPTIEERLKAAQALGPQLSGRQLAQHAFWSIFYANILSNPAVHAANFTLNGAWLYYNIAHRSFMGAVDAAYTKTMKAVLKKDIPRTFFAGDGLHMLASLFGDYTLQGLEQKWTPKLGLITIPQKALDVLGLHDLYARHPWLDKSLARKKAAMASGNIWRGYKAGVEVEQETDTKYERETGHSTTFLMDAGEIAGKNLAASLNKRFGWKLSTSRAAGIPRAARGVGKVWGSVGLFLKLADVYTKVLAESAELAAFDYQALNSAKQGTTEQFLQKMVAEELKFPTRIGGEQYASNQSLSAKELSELDLTRVFDQNLPADQRKENLQAMLSQVRKRRSYRFADLAAFTDPNGPLVEGLMKIRNERGFGIGRAVVPFMQVSTNVFKRGLELTPGLGIAMGKMNKLSATDIAAKQIEGLFIGLAIWSKLAAEELTGAPPDDEPEKFWNSGKLPYAIKLGGKWISYERLEPFGAPFAIAADLFNEWKEIGREGEDDMTADAKSYQIVTRLAHAMVSGMLDRTWASGLRDVSSESPKTLAELPPKTLANMIPFSGAMRTLVKQFREDGGNVTLHGKDSFADIFGQGLGLGTGKELLNVWGEPKSVEGGFLGPIPREWIPVKYSSPTTDPVEQAFEELEWYPGAPSRIIKMPGVGQVELDDETYLPYAMNVGKALKQAALELVQSRWYKNAATEVRSELMRQRLQGVRVRELKRFKMEVARGKHSVFEMKKVEGRESEEELRLAKIDHR